MQTRMPSEMTATQTRVLFNGSITEIWYFSCLIYMLNKIPVTRKHTGFYKMGQILQQNSKKTGLMCKQSDCCPVSARPIRTIQATENSQCTAVTANTPRAGTGCVVTLTALPQKSIVTACHRDNGRSCETLSCQSLSLRDWMKPDSATFSMRIGLFRRLTNQLMLAS